MRWLLTLTAILVLGLLPGCHRNRQPPDRLQQMFASGMDPNYVVGYAEGSESARAAAGDRRAYWRKAPRRYEINSLYRQGWDDGFDAARIFASDRRRAREQQNLQWQRVLDQQQNELRLQQHESDDYYKRQLERPFP